MVDIEKASSRLEKREFKDMKDLKPANTGRDD
jgi:hypothetical protein